MKWKQTSCAYSFVCVFVRFYHVSANDLKHRWTSLVHFSSHLQLSSSLSLPGADLFSNCTEECKALGHSDRCWMPTFVPSDGRQGPDYRSNLHVPGMDSVPDTEVFQSPEQMTDKSFSTFGKETPLSHQYLHNHHHLLQNHHHHPAHGSLERKELDAFLPNTRVPYNPAYLSEYPVLLHDFGIAICPTS